MADGEINDTIAAVGYVKVIAALSREAAAAVATSRSAAAAMGVTTRAAAGRGLGRRGPEATTSDVEASLASSFIIPDDAEMTSLAMTARSASGRPATRAAAAPLPRVRIYPRLGLAVGYVDAKGAAALESNPAVESLVKAPELSLIRPVAARPADPKAVVSWGVQRLGADRMWAAGFDGTGVVVGHLDTGVDGAHPMLQGAIAAFAEFDMAGDAVPGAAARDSGEHGTHTAGTIVGRPGTKGSFGMAPGARLVSGMVIEGGQVIERILSGMEWIIESGCHILSMSLGLRGYTPAFEAIVTALRGAGVLPIFAVGNEGPLTSRSPGNYDNVLSVGAIDSNDRVADFSSSQKFDRPNDPLVPDLAGPGVGILSSIPGGGYAEMDGTSMATPHIAGLAALLLQAKPDATPEAIEQAILDSCKALSGPTGVRANRGVPDAARAYKALTGKTLPAAGVAAAAVRKAPRAAAPRRGQEKMPVAAARTTRAPKK